MELELRPARGDREHRVVQAVEVRDLRGEDVQPLADA
jgi:hypothetical protein